MPSCLQKQFAERSQFVKPVAGSCSKVLAFSPTRSRSRSKWKQTLLADNMTLSPNTRRWAATISAPATPPTLTYRVAQASCKLNFTAFSLLLEPKSNIKNDKPSVMLMKWICLWEVFITTFVFRVGKEKFINDFECSMI